MRALDHVCALLHVAFDDHRTAVRDRHIEAHHDAIGKQPSRPFQHRHRLGPARQSHARDGCTSDRMDLMDDARPLYPVVPGGPHVSSPDIDLADRSALVEIVDR